jgi:hypothetical protein
MQDFFCFGENNFREGGSIDSLFMVHLNRMEMQILSKNIKKRLLTKMK